MASTQRAKRKPKREERKEEEEKNMSLEEIGGYRATAQQNSLETIRAAEERYTKAKDSAAAVLKESKETVGEGIGAAVAYATAKGVEAKDFAVEKSQQGYEAAKEYAQQTADKAVAVKEAVTEKGRRGMEMATEQGSKAYEAAKDAAASVVQTREESPQDEDEQEKGIRGERLTLEKEPEEESPDRELEYLEIRGETTAMEEFYEAVGKTVIGIARFVTDLMSGGGAKPGNGKN
ncbi:uncharacterized protein LOC144700708 [Wolffia australiana]